MSRTILLAVVALLGAGCGEAPQLGGAPQLPPRVDAPTTRMPDGTIPWVDEPAGEREFDTPPPARRPDEPGAPPCRAADLEGALDRWIPNLRRADDGEVLGNDGLVGYARVHNRSARTCFLRGEVPTRLTAGGRPLDIGLAHGVDEEGRERTTTVPPGQAADLRLDWSSPFCGQASGGQVLVLTLPAGGGDLRVPVREPDRPPCSAAGVAPDGSSVLAASAFDEPAVATEDTSPLGVLRARLQPPREPAVPGATLTYHVVLRNPTGRPVPLDPCPGYLQSSFSGARAAGEEAVNETRYYRLNCRPVDHVPAHGRLRFEMAVAVPPHLGAGRELAVEWKLLAPRLGFDPALAGQFSVRVAPAPSSP